MVIETVYRQERPRAFATLIRLLGDFDLAEETLEEAFVAALEQWPSAGEPRNPGAWLVSTARHKALDRLRRAQSFPPKQAEIAEVTEEAHPPPRSRGEPFPNIAPARLFTQPLFAKIAMCRPK